MFVGTGKPRKPSARAAARVLRANGWSYKKIAAELGISSSSALHWTRDIELTPEQIAANLGTGQFTEQTAQLRAEHVAEIKRGRRRAWQEEGRARALESESLHRAGCMLYWAEGTKDRNTLAFCNSDIHMVRAFTEFLRESFGLSPEDFTLRLNVYVDNGLSLEEIEDHWLVGLDLPRTCLRGHQINNFPTSSSGKKRSLPYGVCTLKVLRSTPIIQHIFGAIQEYGGFEEPKWLG